MRSVQAAFVRLLTRVSPKLFRVSVIVLGSFEVVECCDEVCAVDGCEVVALQNVSQCVCGVLADKFVDESWIKHWCPPHCSCRAR